MDEFYADDFSDNFNPKGWTEKDWFLYLKKSEAEIARFAGIYTVNRLRGRSLEEICTIAGWPLPKYGESLDESEEMDAEFSESRGRSITTQSTSSRAASSNACASTSAGSWTKRKSRRRSSGTFPKSSPKPKLSWLSPQIRPTSPKTSSPAATTNVGGKAQRNHGENGRNSGAEIGAGTRENQENRQHNFRPPRSLPEHGRNLCGRQQVIL